LKQQRCIENFNEKPISCQKPR